mgnify:CR=1 FL=1
MITHNSVTEGSTSRNHNKRVVAVDLFCGAGGLTYGLSSSGIKVQVGVDIDPACRYALEENSGAKFVCRDIQDLTAELVAEWFDDAEIRVLAGCAPCQPFSTYSQSRKSNDSRWTLLKEFQRIAVELLPEIVTMENVAGLSKQPVWSQFVDALRTNGYYVDWKIANCVDFGVPQRRKRLVLLASRLGPIALFSPRSMMHATVKHAIGNLPPIEAGGSDPSDRLHAAASLSPINLKRIQASIPGGTWRDWPKRLRTKCHRRTSGKTYPSVYGRMEWSKPAPTMTTQCYGYGNGRFGHPEQNRAISLREAAILQSFPREYKFVPENESVSFSRIGTLIGNAVPPKLGEAIGSSILAHLGEKAVDDMDASMKQLALF